MPEHIAAGPFTGPVRPTRQLGRAALERCLLDLAPGGGCQPRRSPAALVRSYRTVSPLPHTTCAARGGLLSVALSARSPPPGSSPAPCPSESGLSSNGQDRPRPSGRLLHDRGYPRRRLPSDDAPHDRSRRRQRAPWRRLVRRRSTDRRAPPPRLEVRRRCCRPRCGARPFVSSRPTAQRCSAATTSKRSPRLR